MWLFFKDFSDHIFQVRFVGLMVFKEIGMNVKNYKISKLIMRTRKTKIDMKGEREGNNILPAVWWLERRQCYTQAVCAKALPFNRLREGEKFRWRVCAEGQTHCRWLCTMRCKMSAMERRDAPIIFSAVLTILRNLAADNETVWFPKQAVMQLLRMPLIVPLQSVVRKRQGGWVMSFFFPLQKVKLLLGCLGHETGVKEVRWISFDESEKNKKISKWDSITFNSELRIHNMENFNYITVIDIITIFLSAVKCFMFQYLNKIWLPHY